MRVALGVGLLPCPAITTDLIEAPLGAPAQGLPGQRWVGHGDGGIPWPARHHLIGDRAAAGQRVWWLEVSRR